MSGITVKFKAGAAITHKATAAVVGGQVVEPGTGQRTCKPATAGSAKWLGVALTDAAPKPATLPVGQLYVGTDQVAVAGPGDVVPVVSDGTAVVGEIVAAGDNGAVTKAAENAAAGTVVGRVIETFDDAAKTVLVRIAGV